MYVAMYETIHTIGPHLRKKNTSQYYQNCICIVVVLKQDHRTNKYQFISLHSNVALYTLPNTGMINYTTISLR